MDTSICAVCGKSTVHVWTILGGGIWMSESRERMTRHYDWLMGTTGNVVPAVETDIPIRCIIGKSGYRYGTWPKEALWCEHCKSLLLVRLGHSNG